MVSVIIPAYNCRNYLRLAVESALKQSYADIEVLIIDDCSTDDTLVLAQELASDDKRIRVLSNAQNIGVANTRNRGIAASNGEYIAFLDGDDAWMPDKLEKQLDLMEKKEIDLCYTAYSFMDDEGRDVRKVYHVPEELSWKRLLRENVIGCSAAVFRSEKAQKILMRAEYAHEDYVFWLELLQQGCKAGGVDEALMRYRVSAVSRSGDKRKAAQNRWKIYREFLKLPLQKAALVFVAYALRGAGKHLFF